MIGLLLISLRSIWMSLTALGVLIWFCGYPGLSFQPRHAFHLEFIITWLALFSIVHLVTAGRNLFADRKRGAFTRTQMWQTAGPATKRAVVFFLTALLVLALPLTMARLWQRTRILPVLQQYHTCALEPLRFEEKTNDAGAFYYRPVSVLQFHQPRAARELMKLAGLPVKKIPGFQVEYLAAEFETDGDCTGVGIRTFYDLPEDFFATWDRYELPTGSNKVTFRYFFPVYHFIDTPADLEGFSALPPLRLKALYRVVNQQDFPLLMPVWVFDESVPFRWCQTIPVLGCQL